MHNTHEMSIKPVRAARITDTTDALLDESRVRRHPRNTVKHDVFPHISVWGSSFLAAVPPDSARSPARPSLLRPSLLRPSLTHTSDLFPSHTIISSSHTHTHLVISHLTFTHTHTTQLSHQLTHTLSLSSHHLTPSFSYTHNHLVI